MAGWSKEYSMSRRQNKFPVTPIRIPSRTVEQGTAVISALLIMALAVSIAASLLVKADGWIERVAVSRDKGQAYELTRSGLDYARAILAADARLSAIDTLDEAWARPLPPIQHDGNEISGRIEDLQGYFNLNNLRRASGVVDEQALAAYRRLLATLELPDALADTLADWLDADNSPRESGAESDYYRAEGESVTSNGPLAHFSQLGRVKGYSATVVERLASFTCVLPENQPVNVNTASPEVLHAIQPGLSLAEAHALVQARRTAYFRNEPDFRNRLPSKNLPSALLPLSVASGWFVIHSEAQSGHSRGRLAALVERASDGSSTRIAWTSLQ